MIFHRLYEYQKLEFEFVVKKRSAFLFDSWVDKNIISNNYLILLICT